ncbi:DUF932 domain-containing protein [Actinomadura formosensis]|uniref:DUF932 domain-containing protein n=1 Tax=Actinomadura formosensis TaxID=60706 RepID=UPI003D9453D3
MSTDVNAQFNDQRAAEFADTGAVRQADGTWRGTGWDEGEVLGRDGLDTSTGRAALYTSTPAWHGLGEVVPGGITDIDTVLDLGGISFGVDKRAVRYVHDGDQRIMGGRFVTVRDDTGAALGVVSGKYQVIGNRQIFTFLEDLTATSGVVWESAGALRGGRKVFVTMRVPETVTIDRGGLDDEVVLFIAMINSHDGRSLSEAVVTPWRIVCGNTERFAVRDARARWGIRHTSGALDRLEEARRTLGLTVRYADAWAAEETALVRTDLAVAEFHRVIADLWPVDDDAPVRTVNAAERRVETLDAMFRAETQRAGRTAYAAEKAITDYLDHVAPRRPGKTMTEEIARATAVLEGTDDETKSRAHRRLLALTRRP